MYDDDVPRSWVDTTIVVDTRHVHNTSSGNHSATDARDDVFRAAGIGRTDVGLTPSKSRVCVDSFVVVFGKVVPIFY